MYFSITCPKIGFTNNPINEFTGITKLLELVMNFLDLDKVNYNGGIFRIGHKVVEVIMKPIIKNKFVLIVNLWNGGNITKVALVSFIMRALSLPIGCQPITTRNSRLE